MAITTHNQIRNRSQLAGEVQNIQYRVSGPKMHSIRSRRLLNIQETAQIKAETNDSNIGD